MSSHALYRVAAVATSAGALLGAQKLHAGTKYLVAPLAAARVASAPGAWAPEHRATSGVAMLALAGSGVGDHFMLAESRACGTSARAHLRRGAAAFAVQQAGFITLMHRRGQQFTRRSTAGAAAILAGLAVLDGVASRAAALPPPSSTTTSALASPASPVSSNALTTLPDPVVATYGALLVAMGVLAQSDASTARGGRLFLASDALIVARQLLPHGPLRRAADGVVMATYTAALSMLVDGLVEQASASGLG